MSADRKELLASVEALARETAASLGLEIVELVFHGQGRHSLLRIDVDRPGLPGVGIADCERLSRALGEKIDELPFFGGPYELQVSSPGIDRPIRTDDDLRRNAGRPVWLEFRDDDGVVRELRGTLSPGGDANAILIESSGVHRPIGRDRILLMRQDVRLGKKRRGGP